jgi:RNA polymerase sigma factor (sigma-70 family)
MPTESIQAVLRHLRQVLGPTNVAERSDADLLAAYVAGAGEAFEELVRRHGRMVLAVCRRALGNEHDAEDAFQATFLVLARKAKVVRWQESVSQWLHAVAVRTASNARVSSERRRRREEAVATMASMSTNTATSNVGPILDEELAGLPGKYSRPLVLCYLEGQTNEQAARELRCPVGTLRVQLMRARELLRSRLARRGLSVGAMTLTALLHDSVRAGQPSTSLILATGRAAEQFTNGSAAGLSSAGALAKGVLHEMFLTKLKMFLGTTVAILAVGISVAVGVAAADRPGAAPQGPDARAGDDPPRPPVKEGKSPLLADGYFQELKEPLQKMFGMKLDGGQLKIHWRSKREPVEAHFLDLRAATGSSREISHTGNRTHFVRDFAGKCEGTLIQRGKPVHLRVQESAEPGRTIELSDDGTGGFWLQISHPDGDYIMLKQTSRGAISALSAVAGNTFAGQGESFTAFYKQHRQAMDRDFLPVLDRFGIAPFLSPMEARVRKAVLAQLVRSPETVAQAEKLIVQLDHDEFAVRTQADRSLHDRYALYEEVIQKKLNDAAVSAEVRQALLRLVNRNGDFARVRQTIELLDLTRDAAYVVDLVELASKEERPKVFAHLARVTGQNHGDNVAAWREWLQTREKRPR